jgi:methyl-accepting chemotaxis protein
MLRQNRKLANQFDVNVSQLVQASVTAGQEAGQRAQAETTIARQFLGFIAGVSLASSLLVAWLYVVRQVGRRLRGMAQAMGELAGGDLDVVVAGQHQVDEIGQMARSLEVFRAQAKDNRQLMADQVAERERAQQAKTAALAQMADTIETQMDAVLAQVSQRTAAMIAMADSMTESASRTDAQARSADAAAADAMSSVQTVASVAELLTGSVRQITEQVEAAVAVVGQAVDAGQETRLAMDSLGQKTTSIGSVAGMIRGRSRRGPICWH